MSTSAEDQPSTVRINITENPFIQRPTSNRQSRRGSKIPSTNMTFKQVMTLTATVIGCFGLFAILKRFCEN